MVRTGPPILPLTSAVKTKVVNTPAEERRLPMMKRMVTLFQAVSHSAPLRPSPNPAAYTHIIHAMRYNPIAWLNSGRRDPSGFW